MYKKRHLYRLLFLLCLVIAMRTTGNAQKKYFIYIQAENRQPFYVMLQNRNYSSTANGYLVIPRLRNGKYFFVAGFPKDIYPEQKFTYTINDKDAGFVLKQFGTKGWGLFNLTDFSSIMANPEGWDQEKATGDTVLIKDDGYAVAPIKESNEGSVATNNQATMNAGRSGESNVVAAPPVVSAGVVVTPATSSAANTNATNSAFEKEIAGNKYGMVKAYERKAAMGLDQVYIDYNNGGKPDTVTIFIPFAQPVSKAGSADQYNRSCVNLVTEPDYLKLRKQMSAEVSDDKMIQVIKRNRNKCLSVDQVKSLGLLFVSEQSRLKFFEASKPAIYDLVNYPSLETAFTMPAIIEQFRKTAL